MRRLWAGFFAIVAGMLVSIAPALAWTETVCDFVTGGGFYYVNGQKATFAVTGGRLQDTKFWGHIEYNNHLGLVLSHATVTDYDYVNATTREIAGTALINNAIRVTYDAVVTDNGEPGRADYFSLTLSNGYRAAGYLQGGNFEIHPVCRG